MPNHCANRMIVTGTQPDINAFLKFFMTDDGFQFDTDRWIHMPEALDGIVSGSCMIDGERCDCFRTVDGQNIAVSEEEKDQLLEQYGALNWYDWKISVLGTKWGAYESRIEDIDDDTNPLPAISIRYQTAWSPLSSRCLELLSKRFPDLKLVVTYAEQGCCFAGSMTLTGGLLIDDEYFENGIVFKPVDEDGNEVSSEDDAYDYVYAGVHPERFKDLFEASG